MHIDFGITFEKGRCLPTPECVPFRLTRALVAAMGPNGYNGLFRKSCEITMQVLKDNQAMIMAVLEVLLYDPLYSWELTNEKIMKTQSVENFEISAITSHTTETEFEEKNVAAQRVLQRVISKLNGRLDDQPNELSVSGVVDYLIKEAVDEKNLCRNFWAWSAHL